MEWPDKCIAPLREGTFARIASVLAEGEDRTAFIRKAIESELTHREHPVVSEARLKRAATKEAKGK